MSYTNCPEINNLLGDFLGKVKYILGPDFVGMYLYGSLALGDFNIESSDVDILVAIKDALSDERAEKLRDMHESLSKKLEVAYMPLNILKKYSPTNNKNLFISPVANFGEVELGEDWVLNRWIIRERGIVLEGPDPKTLIDYISSDEIKEATKNILCNSWSKHISGSDWMKPKKYQAFTVLTMCRALYSIEKGEVASKSVAANWALENLDTTWRALINEALANQNNSSEGDLSGTLKFLKYVVNRICG